MEKGRYVHNKKENRGNKGEGKKEGDGKKSNGRNGAGGNKGTDDSQSVGGSQSVRGSYSVGRSQSAGGSQSSGRCRRTDRNPKAYESQGMAGSQKADRSQKKEVSLKTGGNQRDAWKQKLSGKHTSGESERAELGQKADGNRAAVWKQKIGGKQKPCGNQIPGRGKNVYRTHKSDQYQKAGAKRSSLCPVERQCGGCQMLNMDYSEQLKRKQRKVEDLLKGICPVKSIIGMKDPFHYRNKVHAVFDRDKRGNVISGIYQENTHILVPVEKCMIEDEKADEIIGTIRGMLKSFKIRTYDEDTGYGFLRHALIRRGTSTGEIMVVLVTASPVFPSKNNFVKALRVKHPEITTIIQNINNRGTSMVLGDKEHVLYGKGFIVDELCGCKFRISSRSFYQVNPVQTEVLYGKALELAGLTGKELVLDAYCGIGTIGIIASRQAGQVIGVELNQEAVRDAVNNAKINGIDNIHFYCNDAGHFLVNMAERGEKADVVIMDPPRTGSTEEFMDAIAKMGAEKVVYVSCNPETLARDVKYLGKKGYRGIVGVPVDMFPATVHVETAVLLVRKP